MKTSTLKFNIPNKILATLTAKYSSLVDKDNYKMPDIYIDNNHLYIEEGAGTDKVYVEITRTDKGWTLTATKNGKTFEDRHRQTLDQIIMFAEYIFHCEFDKKERAMFSKIKPEKERPKDYRKILKTIDTLYSDGDLEDNLIKYTIAKHKKNPDQSYLTTLEKTIYKKVQPLQKYKNELKDVSFWLDPLKFQLTLPVGATEGLGSSKSIEKYYSSLLDEQKDEVYDYFNVYDFKQYDYLF